MFNVLLKCIVGPGKGQMMVNQVCVLSVIVLFTLSLGVILRLCSMIVSFPENSKINAKHIVVMQKGKASSVAFQVLNYSQANLADKLLFHSMNTVM